MYRNAQTVLAAAGQLPPSLRELAGLMGTGRQLASFEAGGWRAARRRELWVEPHDVAEAFAIRWPMLETQLLLFAPMEAGRWAMRRSECTGLESEYAVERCVQRLRRQVVKHLAETRLPVLVDNGGEPLLRTAARGGADAAAAASVYSFAIAGMRHCCGGDAVEYRILDL